MNPLFSITDTSRPKVLIVDDRPENLVVIERLLHGMDIELIRANSGNEALALILDHEFALALVDVQMPGMDGYETVELMHREIPPEKLPVIFVSAVYSGELHEIKGVEVGAVDFIEKPIVPAILQGKVKIFLDLYRSRKILENVNDVLMKQVEEKTASLNDTYEKLIRETKEHFDLQQRMQQVQKMEAIGTMAGGIAHDFNNILAIIQLNASVLLDDVPPGEEMEDIRLGLQEIILAGSRGKDLTEKILTFSRKKKQQNQEAGSVNIRDAVKGSTDMVRHILPATVSLEVLFENDCGYIDAHQTDIYQIILNLCVNAKDAMNEKGTLRVSLQAGEPDNSNCIASLQMPEGKCVRFSVSDSGAGIAAENLERIFDPFYTTKAVGKGTGMGLSVVHGLVKDLRGTIGVESQPGKGTTFHVYLPVAEDQPLPDEHEYRSEGLSGVESILFVDDETVLASLGERILMGKGYQVEKCTSSMVALEAFRATPEKYDLIITDNYMPEMDGVDLAGEVLNIRSDIPIILCTGYSSKVTETNFRDYGFCSILMKPYRPQELFATVRGVLDC